MKDLLAAIKDAMRGEMDSINIYKHALANTNDEEVKAFFENRVKEEKEHYNYLVDHYSSLTNDKALKKIEFTEGENLIFSENFKRRIGESQILFSAISVATMLEKNAFEFYGRAAEKTKDIQMKEFFNKMATWEKQHYDDLLEIAEESEQYYWQQNRFEPF
ncbi:MAG: ferritin family protein [Candidatus Tenebribacter davisii]|jgi:rubrerythrin|nr:ferritin family protein [Candidatus Tenebribacter davisii]